MSQKFHLRVICGLILGSIVVSCQIFEEDPAVGGYYKPGVTALEILRARGYLAEEFFFKTEDGYFLNIIRSRNPLINNGEGGLEDKEPILFIHGVLSSAAIWVISSRGAQPRDFTNIQVNETSKERLIELVGDDPGTFALPMMFMNFGHEVWLLNRRGTLQSEQREGGEGRTLLDAFKEIIPTIAGGGYGPNLGLGVFNIFKPINSSNVVTGKSAWNLTKEQEEQIAAFDDEKFISSMKGTSAMNNSLQLKRPMDQKSLIGDFFQPIINLPGALFDFGNLIRRFIHTFDAKFWAYSLDEQVKYDVSGSVDFVLEKTGKKQLTLIAHSSGSALVLLKLSESPEFSEKLSKTVLLAPSLNLGHADLGSILFPVIIPLEAYLGPFPFAFMSQQLQGIAQVICNNVLSQYSICEGISDFLFGFSAGQEPVSPAFLATGLQPVAGRELLHYGQFVTDKVPRKYKFNSPDENLKVYGTFEPPFYDLSRITMKKMSIFTSTNDFLVTPKDILVTVNQLSVPHRLNVIGADEIGAFFNHVGYFIHKRLNVLSSIPILREVEIFLNR